LNQSQFIKSIIKERKGKEEEEMSLKVRVSSDGTDYVSIEQIPEVIRDFYNYGSELEPIFAHIAE
jgi:predicted nucleic acid-binding Zn finger protein